MRQVSPSELDNVQIFTGSSHTELSALILDRLGQAAAPAIVKRSDNMEMGVELGVSVRNQDVFIIQSGSSTINDHLMELLIMINACKLASARRITAVIPYLPYSKQSKKKKARGSITAKLIANMLQVSGVDHIITLDLHSTQIQGFFGKPVDNLLAEPVIAQYIQSCLAEFGSGQESGGPVKGCVISKNAGGAKRVTSLADILKLDFALIHRESHFQASKKVLPGDEVMRLTLVGNVKDMVCFVVDDIINDIHTFLDTAEHLKQCQAKKVIIVATHGILSREALIEIDENVAVDEIAITNSYPMSDDLKNITSKLKIIDVSGVLAEAIRRTHNGESISYLFSHVV
ncbi:UNVERIFIED_CONTAM: Ribose-phosphate pyrophosphokinase 2 [Siphonaria sp. JEL0065]|nr:Ribose-phosphate pyrophosphokinase 2 [Siphonaria sp. JEL0065]